MKNELLNTYQALTGEIERVRRSGAAPATVESMTARLWDARLAVARQMGKLGGF